MLRTFARSVLCLALAALPVLAQERARGAGSRWGADYFPNVELVTHEGRTVRFFDDLVKEKVVVISFIYTSCADACPLETAKLGEVQSLLGERLGKDVFFYSISIDPERDTPEVLHDYAERFGAGPGWLFLTGAKDDIRELRKKLGMIAPSGIEELSDHTLSLLIGNQSTGKWMKRSPFESPHLLATQIGTWLTNWKAPPVAGRDYASAPKLRDITKGESLFRTRCSACHVLGPDDGIARQGPPLFGVTTRRERAWLARWLAEPDVMLAEKDPLALELFAANRGVVMPNLRLQPSEVEALLEFMTAEDARLAEQVRTSSEATAERPPCCQKEELEVFEGASASTQPPAPAGAAGGPGRDLFFCVAALLLLGGLAGLTGRA
ncbi:MAG: SCO family protein [Planctomycetota bacterium]